METQVQPMVSPRQTARPGSHRISSIDLLRGLVMIIMALDHTRDYFHREAMTGDPLNFDTTTPILFFTRWITHYCAPIFVFLAGCSAYLQSLRKSKKELSLFLIKRGFWLVLVEVTIVTLGISFDPGYSFIFLQTIWSIGVSMMVLGLALWLPFSALLVLALAIVLGHNALDYYENGKNDLGVFYSFLHRPGGFNIGNRQVLILYPVLSWIGLMMLGFCFGRVYTLFEGAGRRKVLMTLGTGIILFFIALRWTNSYGDAAAWKEQKDALFTTLSFVNTTKYPPSLLFMCMTIGPGILFLAFAENWRNRLSRIITVYGKVPFLYYILHFYLLHLLTALFFLGRGHSFSEGAKGITGFPFKFLMPGEGLSLGGVYLVWIAVVIALYPVCYWFSKYKERSRKWWLSYL